MKRLYVDMDGVLVDFASGITRLKENPAAYANADPKHFDDAPGIFALMDPMPGAIAAFETLSKEFDIYILSTAPWGNNSAWSDKHAWVRKHLGVVAEKRLILSHHKNLLRGDFLIDDRTAHGVTEFVGEHIHFGTPAFPDWTAVSAYLLARAG